MYADTYSDILGVNKLYRWENSMQRSSFLFSCEAMFTLYANRGSLDRLVASQVRPRQSNLMLLSLIDPNFG